MARKSGVGNQKAITINPFQAPTLYSNLCEVRTVGGDVRITFREVLMVTDAEMTSRELMHVYLNPGIARAFAKILSDAVGRVTAETGEKEVARP